MIMAHKIISTNIFLALLAPLPSERSVTRRHSQKIFKKHCLIRERSLFFIQQVTNLEAKSRQRMAIAGVSLQLGSY